jgi:hypothetical protein
VVPPKDIEARRRIVTLIKRIWRGRVEGQDEELQTSRWDEKRIQDMSDIGPWGIY